MSDVSNKANCMSLQKSSLQRLYHLIWWFKNQVYSATKIINAHLKILWQYGNRVGQVCVSPMIGMTSQSVTAGIRWMMSPDMYLRHLLSIFHPLVHTCFILMPKNARFIQCDAWNWRRNFEPKKTACRPVGQNTQIFARMLPNLSCDSLNCCSLTEGASKGSVSRQLWNTGESVSSCCH